MVGVRATLNTGKVLEAEIEFTDDLEDFYMEVIRSGAVMIEIFEDNLQGPLVETLVPTSKSAN